MSRGSRSPKRDRHHKPSRHHRERSRERESSLASSSGSKHKKHRKSSRDRDDKHRHRERDDQYKEAPTSVRRYDTTQRGIDAAKNRLRASLGTAINDLNDRNQMPGPSKSFINERDSSDPVSVFDTLNRQKAIEQIQQDGFTPAQFHSSGNNSSADTFNTKGKTALGEETAEAKLHERAMFGALWTSREIEKKLLKDEKSTAPKEETLDDETDEVKVTGEFNANSAANAKRAEPSIAHERLSADPAVRQGKWLEIFRHRRRALIEGIE